MSQPVTACPTCGTAFPFPRRFVGGGPSGCEHCSAERVAAHARATVLRLLESPSSALPADADTGPSAGSLRHSSADSAVHLSWRTARPQYLLHGPVLLVFSAGFIAEAIRRLSSGQAPLGHLPFSAFVGALGGIAAFLGACTIGRQLERIVLRVTARTLTVRAGLFGLIPRLHLEAGRVQQLWVALRRAPLLDRESTPFPGPRYAVVAQLREGARVDVASNLDTAEQAVWLARTLTHALDLRERPGLHAEGTPSLLAGAGGAQAAREP